jgi:hypothetical protein
MSISAVFADDDDDERTVEQEKKGVGGTDYTSEKEEKGIS